MTFRIKREMCPTCIFRPGNPMNLRSGRVTEMVQSAEATDSYIVCHDTLEIATGDKRTEAMCRGYIDSGRQPQMYRIADRLGMLEEVD